MSRSSNNLLWMNKYKPKTTSEIIGNSIAIKKLKSWISNYKKKDSKKSAIISGHHGIGKTISVELSLKEAGYDPQILYPNDIKSHKLMDEIIQFTNYNDSIYNKMCKKINKKYVLIIDEAESITLTSEKNYLMSLNKTNNKYKFFPIIFICNTQHSKMITEIRKTACEIKYDAIWSFEMEPHIEDKKNMINEFLRILKPGGILILGCWNSTEKEMKDTFLLDEWTHPNFWTIQQYKDVFSSHNLVKEYDSMDITKNTLPSWEESIKEGLRKPSILIKKPTKIFSMMREIIPITKMADAFDNNYMAFGVFVVTKK